MKKEFFLILRWTCLSDISLLSLGRLEATNWHSFFYPETAHDEMKIMQERIKARRGWKRVGVKEGKRERGSDRLSMCVCVCAGSCVHVCVRVSDWGKKNEGGRECVCVCAWEGERERKEEVKLCAHLLSRNRSKLSLPLRFNIGSNWNKWKKPTKKNLNPESPRVYCNQLVQTIAWV